MAARSHHPGQRLFLPSDSSAGAFSAVFEDDGVTAYFHAYDRSKSAQRILDAVHVYDVEAILDRHKPSEVVIVWSSDGLKAGLLINDNLWAVLDFAASKGYGRTNFPKQSAWDGQPRDPWHDRLASLLI